MVDGHRRVARNQRRGHSTQCLYAKRQGRDIDQDNVADFAGEDPGLNGRATGNAFHGINAHLRRTTEQFFKVGAYGWHARWAADEHQAIDLPHGQATVAQGLVHRATTTLDDRPHQAL